MKNVLIVVLLAVGVICLVLAGGAGLVAWQMGIHLWDNNQAPAIIVGSGLRPVISFTPDTAYNLSVYEGSEDGDGFGTIWHATEPGGFENNLRSPVTYGIPPEGSEGTEAPALESGKTYTVSIFRKDPQGGGDSFTNTRHRYVGIKTFVATEE